MGEVVQLPRRYGVRRHVRTGVRIDPAALLREREMARKGVARRYQIA